MCVDSQVWAVFTREQQSFRFYASLQQLSVRVVQLQLHCTVS